MSLSQLTKKEKLVFYNLVKFPDLNDNELAERIEIKRSTVTAIRNRLKKDGFYSTVVVPNLPALGCRLLGVSYGKYNPLTPRAERMKASTFEEKLKQPELVFARSTDTEFINLYVAEHLADIRKVQDKSYVDYEAHGFIEEFNVVYYPFELSSITSMFNFGPLLKRLFGITEDNGEDYKGSFWSTGKDNVDLTTIEKAVLDALVKYPEATVIELSKKTGKSRGTISKIRKEMMSSSLIRVINIPSLEKLGCELLSFLYTRFSPKCPFEVRKQRSEKMMEIYYPILKVSGDIESIAICVMKNYTEYTNIHNSILTLYKDSDYIVGNLYTLLFPILQTKLNKLDFYPITHKMLFENGK